MRSELNRLVPADEMHWDESSNSYQVLSQGQVDEIIRACMGVGMEDAKSILKVVREYERVRCGELLFEQFFAGRIGICGFDDAGSPIFDSSRRAAEAKLSFTCERESNANGYSVSCAEGEDEVPLFGEIIETCSRWGVDLFGGENPEVLGVIDDDPDFQREFKARGWRVSRVESHGGTAAVEVVVRRPVG